VQLYINGSGGPPLTAQNAASRYYFTNERTRKTESHFRFETEIASSWIFAERAYCYGGNGRESW